MEGAVNDVDVEAFVKLKLEKGFAVAAPPPPPPRDGAAAAAAEVEAEAAAVFDCLHLLVFVLRILRPLSTSEDALAKPLPAEDPRATAAS